MTFWMKKIRLHGKFWPFTRISFLVCFVCLFFFSKLYFVRRHWSCWCPCNLCKINTGLARRCSQKAVIIISPLLLPPPHFFFFFFCNSKKNCVNWQKFLILKYIITINSKFSYRFVFIVSSLFLYHSNIYVIDSRGLIDWLIDFSFYFFFHPFLFFYFIFLFLFFFKFY